MMRRSLRLALAVAVALAACRSVPVQKESSAGAQARSATADRSTIPQPGPAPKLQVPPQVHFQLKNGLKVRLVEHHRLPIVALNLVVDAGAVHDPPARPGLASFTAAMMTEGTKRRSATRISDDLGFIGASLGAGAGFDSASLSASTLSEHLDALLEIFADVLIAPTFPASDFARVQDQRLVALVQQRDEPRVVAAKAFSQAYWGEHPYGHWSMGTEESVRATKRDDLIAFHAARWRPGASELVVVGDVTRADLEKKLEWAIGAWNGTPAPTAPPPQARAPEPSTVLIEKRGPAPQAYVMLGMPGLPRSDPDYVAAEVATEVLGGGSSSRLFRNLREKEGYTYGIYAREEARKLGGSSIIAGSVKTDVTGAAMRATLDEIRGMRERPVPEAELAVARNSLLLSLPAEFAGVSGIAAKLGEEIVYGLPDDYWDSYAQQVAKVSPDEVQRVARRILDPARITAVMVGDPAAVKPQLTGLPLGTVTVRGEAAARR